MAESGYGRIRMFQEFAGGELIIANDVAYGTAESHPRLGDFKVTGNIGETDAGIFTLEKAGGWARINGSNQDAKGVAIGTEVCFSPALNGPLAIEARVEMVALTTRAAWLGFVDVNADDVAEVMTGVTETLTLTASDSSGFFYDSQLTANESWHMAHNGGSTTGSTDATAVVAPNDVVVASTSQVLRVEVDTNGTVRWYIDGLLRQTVVNALAPTVLLAGYLGSWCTANTLADIDADYLAVEANRNWTV